VAGIFEKTPENRDLAVVFFADPCYNRQARCSKYRMGGVCFKMTIYCAWFGWQSTYSYPGFIFLTQNATYCGSGIFPLDQNEIMWYDSDTAGKCGGFSGIYRRKPLRRTYKILSRGEDPL
jgi:hypothetical protein